MRRVQSHGVCSSDHNQSGKGKRSQGKRSQSGKGGTGSKRGQSSKGNQGSSQGSKGGKGRPDGGLSPPQPNQSSLNQLRWPAQQKQNKCIGGNQCGGGRVAVGATPGGSSLEGVGAMFGQRIVLR